MKRSANWYTRVVTMLLALVVVAAALGCGGSNGGTLNLNAANNNAGASTSNANKGVGVLVAEDEVGQLPTWQQELLSDPGWNQPYIEPTPGTEIIAPTDEMLEESMQRMLEEGLAMAPRQSTSGSKAASWDIQGPFDEEWSISRGEYESYSGVGAPPFGCNANDDNDYHTKNKGCEDAIFATPGHGFQRISYVRRETADTNYFVQGASAGNNAASCVYQLYSDNEGADPKDPDDPSQIEEVSYRADLAIDPSTSLPAEPDGECPNAEAFLVSGTYWRKFNSEFNVLPNYASVPLYSVFIAPSSEEHAAETSSESTVATYQEFYLGNQEGLYNDAWIVGLESTTGGCAAWQTLVTNNAESGFFHTPIYGVLLARWQDSIQSDFPWESTFGWPVHGPTALSAGVTVTSRGQYYAWGMWFERGFIWWIDYDQDRNPATPDEAQAFLYTGDNVYCKDGTYVSLEPTLYYGGNGPLAVNVSVDGMRYVGTDPWSPVPFNDSTLQYEIPLEDSGFDTVTLAMHAQAYGGVTNDEGLYKHYVWAFRDGFVLPSGGSGYENLNRYVTHTYGSTTQNLEGTYVVRVQVTDASMDEGLSATEVRAYGDSFPIVLGHSLTADIMIIRDDQGPNSSVTTGPYDTNMSAITDDLDELRGIFPGLSYTERDFDPSTYMADIADAKLVIWYRGGPGTTSETPLADQYNDDEIAALEATLGHKPLLTFSQNSAAFGHYYSGKPNYYEYYSYTQYWDPVYDEAKPSSGPYSNEQDFLNAIMGFNYYLYNGSTYFRGFCMSGGKGTYQYQTGSNLSSALGEGFLGTLSSGKRPATGVYSDGTQQYDWPIGTQINGFYSSQYPMQSSSYIARGLYFGSSRYASAGNTHPDSFNYVIGYPWASFTINLGTPSTPERWEVLQNVLASLAPSVFDDDASASFEIYSGVPEIIAVTPSYVDDTGAWHAGVKTITYADQVGYAGGGYPDQTGTNVYRSTDPGTGNYVITGSPNNDWINANDVDFQYPWYAYVYDPDESLLYDDWDGLGAPAQVSNDEVFLGYNGLVVEDPDTVWTRTDKIAWLDPTFVTVAGWDEELLRPVVGYYVTTDDVASTPALDTATKANYGTDVPALTDWDNKYTLHAEVVAHWDEATLPIMAWSMFPGHGLFDPYTGDEIPWDTDYYTYMSNFDVDPSYPVAARDFPTNMYQQVWNQARFANLSVENGGRYVDWDMTLVRNWNGDLNGDGLQNDADKFPVRCRLILDPAATFGIWPDHMLNPGSEPAGGAVPVDGDFIEGGAYVVDTGVPLYPLDIYDDALMPNPDADNMVMWAGGEDFTVNLYFGIKYGEAPYTVELDCNYNGFSFGDDDAGDGYDEIYTIEPVQAGNTLTGGPDEGLRQATVSITYPLGTYYFALRVSDGTEEDILWYSSDLVTLQQYVATSPWLIVDDGNTAGSDALEANFTAIAPLSTLPPTTVPDRLTADNPLLNGDPAAIRTIMNQYDVMVWNAGDTSATCSLTDEQAEAAYDAMATDGLTVMYFKPVINTSSSGGTTNQRTFITGVSGLSSGLSPGNYTDTLIAWGAITSGPGGALNVLAPDFAASDISTGNFISGTNIWGVEQGWTSYAWITQVSTGSGKGVWVARSWSQITSTVQQGLLHNMLYQLDPVTYGEPPTPSRAIVIHDPLTQGTGAYVDGSVKMYDDLVDLYGSSWLGIDEWDIAVDGDLTASDLMFDSDGDLTPDTYYTLIAWASDAQFDCRGLSSPGTFPGSFTGNWAYPNVPNGSHFTMGAGNANANAVQTAVDNGSRLLMFGGGLMVLNAIDEGGFISGGYSGFNGAGSWYNDGDDQFLYFESYSAAIPTVPNAYACWDDFLTLAEGAIGINRNTTTVSAGNGYNVGTAGYASNAIRVTNGYSSSPTSSYVGGCSSAPNGNGGSVTMIMVNYGDIDDGGHTYGARSLGLENVLCLGDGGSPFVAP